MKTLEFSLIIKITGTSIDEIKKPVLKYHPIIKQAYWLKIRDPKADFYMISFKNIEIGEFKTISSGIEKLSWAEGISIAFESKHDCLSLLQDKGFKKYEETEYVNFKYEKRNVIVGVSKDSLYNLKVNRIEESIPIQVSYFFGLIDRVFEIIGQNGGKN